MDWKFYWFFGLITILSIIFISGCVQHVPEGQLIKTNLDSSFQLKIGQTGFIESENLKIKFLNVTEDSRCPSGVQCFWAGQASILVNILKNDQNLDDFKLTEYGIGVNFGGDSIKLLKVAPYPKKFQRIDILDYMVTLIISKK